VFSLGGRFGYTDDGETANTQMCVFDYGNATMIFEVRGLTTDAYKGAKVGNIWVGSEGYVVCPNYGGGTAYDKAGKELAKFSGGGDQNHFDNFVKAVRSRKFTDLNCDIAEGHLSASLCHLANISYRLGRAEVIGKANNISDDKNVNSFAATMVEHLKANKVDTDKIMGKFGPNLAIDTKTEKFLARDSKVAEAANAMLFREYRKGFELKEIA
jgi:hypothetical protein